MSPPKIEVRYNNVTVDAKVHVGSRALPTLTNDIRNMAEVSSSTGVLLIIPVGQHLDRLARASETAAL